MPDQQYPPATHKDQDPGDQDLDDLKGDLVAYFEGEHAKLITKCGEMLAKVEQEKFTALQELKILTDKSEKEKTERDVALKQLEKEVYALRGDRDRYKELDAQTTKHLLDTVNPVLRWVRLRGPREHGFLPLPEHDTTEWSAHTTISSPTSECPPFHYIQHRMGMCFHSKNVTGSEKYKEWPSDRIFLESETTSVLWDQAFHLVRSAMNESRNALFVAYGQTGTGKSSTMISDIKGSTSQDTSPFLLRALDFIYDRQNGDFNVEIMVLQQYKSIITDLSVDSPPHKEELALVELTRSHIDLTIEGRLKYKLQKTNRTPIKFHSHDTVAAARKHIDNSLQRRKRDTTPQNECSSRSHTFVFLRIKDRSDGRHRGLITLVDLAGQENQPIRSGDAGRKSKEDEDAAIHKSITQSLAKFKGFIKCFAAAESRGPGSEPPSKLHLSKFNHPLTDLLRLVVEVTPGQPLPSMVIIAHVSTVKQDAAESKKTLEWLDNCKSDSSEGKKKMQSASKDEEKQWEQLLLEANQKALRWEEFARNEVEEERCDEFAKSLDEMGGVEAEGTKQSGL
ncbi:P-loop containing nucleoside triphosphate hydrolase protein [Paraphoma chrysanthemicola]|uniref:P-loop containing nucleoside triphosphate hydrolase protein n=1 Tax=Paraphoma chrysanthemicola TaxID=798071 RepID=A0A8K0VSE7_9PLEO|nr:P-loop containing nucleoside triphosphate hydrolase protein [Paraphoma chrysanthemicola]